MKTFTAKPKNIQYNWYIVDATNKILGRLATKLASRLRGKHKPEYTPHIDTGDYIIIINAKKISTTGNKNYDKMYYHHSGYVGGMKKISLRDMLHRNPERVLEIAVKGMLPKGPLGRAMSRKLKIFAGDKHCHEAQKPQILNI